MSESEFLRILGTYSRINPLLAWFQAELRALLGRAPEGYCRVIEQVMALCRTKQDVWDLDADTLSGLLAAEGAAS